jgi:hypothetical protein
MKRRATLSETNRCREKNSRNNMKRRATLSETSGCREKNSRNNHETESNTVGNNWM